MTSNNSTSEKICPRKQKHYTKETSKQPHVQGNVYNIQNMELTWVSIDGWMDKRLWHIQGVLFNHKEKEILPVVATQFGLWGHYNKWIKSDKNKYCMISLLWWLLKKKKKNRKRDQILLARSRRWIVRMRKSHKSMNFNNNVNKYWGYLGYNEWHDDDSDQ